jgi:acetylornithine deacetylase/succinyl-diaminopimelate desuccinylase-like protein
MSYDVVSLLQDLIRIPSVNPDNAPGTELVGEQALAEFLVAWLEPLGAVCTLEEIQPGRPNFIARFAPLDGRPRILLGPHLDTVGVGGMTVEPFGGVIRDGKIWGRGASDTKGPMAAMLWALRENRESLADSPVAVDFVAFMGEESGQWGSKDFGKRHGAHYQFAVVGEPTTMQVVHVTKGSLWATLRATGKAAHSSQPERGDNAILKLTRALVLLDQALMPELASFTHPQLGHSTLNVGMIRGGSRPNIVPDLAEVELDIRITPALTAAGGALALLKETLTRLDLPLEIVRAHENPPMETPPDHPMILALLATDAGTARACAPWFSDAAHLAHAGIPSICIGPGSIDQAHTVDEFLEISALEQGAEFFSKFVASVSRP